MVAAAVFFALFSLGMIKARTRRQVLTLALVGTIAAMLVAPRPVRAQGTLIGAIQAVLSVINGVLHTVLTSVANARNTINQFYQLRLWPQQMINQARGLVTQMISQYRIPMYNILHVHLASATLPTTRALEPVIRGEKFPTGIWPMAAPESRTHRNSSDVCATRDLILVPPRAWDRRCSAEFCV